MSLRYGFFGQLTTAQTLSLRGQLDRLGERFVHVNCIKVGSDQFTDPDLQEIDAAIARTRDLYATAGHAMAVGRVLHYSILTGDAGGRDVIDSDDEAEELTDEWTVDNDALDLFFVRVYVGMTAGLSRVDGPCDKDAKGMDGSVVEMNSGGGVSDYATAHELGHYLGLDHVDDTSRLMDPTVPNGGVITGDEADDMRDHCRMHDPC